MSVKIIVDSASDIIKSEAEEMGIEMVPLQIQFGEEQYLSGENLMPNEFYEKLKECQELPKTSLVNEFTWKEVYERNLKEYDELIVITISSKLSGTYVNALEAAKGFDNVYVVDSMSACLGERMLCEYALRLLDKGYSAKDVAMELDNAKNKITIMAVVDTLKYLRKGGRISSTVAFVGGVFSIKPIVAMVDGEVKMIGKAMGAKKAYGQLNSIVKSKNVDFDMPFGVLWSGTDSTIADKYIKDSKDIFPDGLKEIPIRTMGSTIGTHVGPGAIGIAFFEK